MFTDKQSLILCAIVAFGFSISGITGLLDNYVIVAVLILLFLLIVVNLFLQKPIDDLDHEALEKELKNKNSNTISNEKT